MPSRKKSKSKIDAVVASIMARGLASVIGREGGRYYESNGIETV
jgi:hypothetical protein